MYSWKTLRTAFALLLFVPVIHVAFLISRDTAASLERSPGVWESEVNDYIKANQAGNLPEDPILVIGGRPVKLWEGLEDILSPRPVLMRGLGDATVDDIIHYHLQLVGYYQPSVVVLLPGSSEFHVRDHKSAPELAQAIRKLVELDQSYDLPRSYYIFAPIKSPLYNEDYATIDEVTRLLEEWARTDEQVTILNPNPLLDLRDGKPNPDFFRLDGINLNEHGYLRVSVLLENQLERDQAVEQTADSAP